MGECTVWCLAEDEEVVAVEVDWVGQAIFDG